MPTKRKRVPIIADPKSLAALGLDAIIPTEVNATALAGALHRYADLFAVATVDLTREFRRRDWEFLADVCRTVVFPAWAGELPAHLAVIEAAEKAHRDRRSGDRWFVTDVERACFTSVANAERADKRVKQICEYLHGLTALHGAVVLAGVHWYWAHHKELETATGEWWSPSVRKKWYEERAANQDAESAQKKRQGNLFSEEE